MTNRNVGIDLPESFTPPRNLHLGKSVTRAGKRGYSKFLALIGKLNFLWSYLKHRLYSRKVIIGLEKDLLDCSYRPQFKLEYDVQLASQKHILEALYRAEVDQDVSVCHLIQQRWFNKPRFPRCYVVLTRDTRDLCCLQWVILPQDMKALQPALKDLKDRSIILKEQECLLEASHTFSQYRNLAIMSSVIIQISQIARSAGYKRMISYVSKDNISSLIDYHKAGFHDFESQTEVNLLFIKRITITKIKPRQNPVNILFTAPLSRNIP